MKALIIDDDPNSTAILAAMLNQLGVESKSALSVQKGKDLLSTFQADVIFLDLFIDSEDGLDFLKSRLQSPKILEIPVVMVSGSSHFDAISICLKRGATSYLIKPIQKDLLLSSLKRLTPIIMKGIDHK